MVNYAYAFSQSESGRYFEWIIKLFKGSFFSVDAAARHSWPNSAIAKGTIHVFMSSVSPAKSNIFTCKFCAWVVFIILFSGLLEFPHGDNWNPLTYGPRKGQSSILSLLFSCPKTYFCSKKSCLASDHVIENDSVFALMSWCDKKPNEQYIEYIEEIAADRCLSVIICYVLLCCVIRRGLVDCP